MTEAVPASGLEQLFLGWPWRAGFRVQCEEGAGREAEAGRSRPAGGGGGGGGGGEAGTRAEGLLWRRRRRRPATSAVGT